MARSKFGKTGGAVARVAAAASLSAAAFPASASFLSGEALDTAASYMAWFVICVVPIVVIVLFWMVHVLPEKIAEKRHHPQKDAIHTLCLLSLVFGGLLWPFAWLWAYTRPVGYRLAYGTEKHDDYYVEMGEKAKSGTLLQDDIVHLRHELDAMAAKGTLPATLKTLRSELDALRIEPTAGERAGDA
jgi:CBS domain containing-hemolysin-like protein